MEHKMTDDADRGIENLLGVDWRQAWIERENVRKLPDDVRVWNERSKDYAKNAGISPYTSTFLEYLLPESGSSILDVGCGSGTLAIPLARQGHTVFAVDFSTGMLNALKDAVEKEDLAGIHCLQLDFNAPWSEWEAVGITSDCVDIAIASRSTIVKNLWAAFEKLERAARSRVAITIATEYGPRGTKYLGESIEGGSPYIPDHIYAINILMQMGRYPTLRYIDSVKTDQGNTPRLTRWAFITWDTYDKERR